MHPELERIYREYCLLVEAYSAGNVSAEDAQRILESLTAIDGDGSLWSLDASTGEFLCARPGGVPQPADPARFASSRLPPAQIDVPPHGAHPGMVSEHLHPALQPLPPERPGRKVGRAVGAGVGGAAKGVGGVVAGLRGLLSGRGRTVALLVVAAVVGAVIVLGSPSRKEPTPAPDSAPPSSLITVPDISIPGEASTVPPPAPPSSATTPPPVVPTDEELAAFAAVLSTGDAAALAAVLPEDPATRLSFAVLLGSARLGYPVTLRNPVVTGVGVRVRVVVGDASSPVSSWSMLLSLQAPWRAVSIEAA